MPRRKTQRYFGELEKNALLSAIENCRRATVEASTKAPIGGDIYRTCDALRDSIDDLAAVLTGDRQHFWLKSGSALR